MVGCGPNGPGFVGGGAWTKALGEFRTSQFFLQSTCSIPVSAPLQLHPQLLPSARTAVATIRTIQCISSSDPHHGPVHLVRDQVCGASPAPLALPPLTCCSAGYALFKAHNKKLLKDGAKDLGTVEGTVDALKLKKFTVQPLWMGACDAVPLLTRAEIRKCCHRAQRSCRAQRKQSVADPLHATQ